jgi:uncharacterized integral membrane protein
VEFFLSHLAQAEMSTASRIARLVLALTLSVGACHATETRQWVMEGPVPDDGVRFWIPAQAVDEADCGQEKWSKATTYAAALLLTQRVNNHEIHLHLLKTDYGFQLDEYIVGDDGRGERRFGEHENVCYCGIFVDSEIAQKLISAVVSHQHGAEKKDNTNFLIGLFVVMGLLLIVYRVADTRAKSLPVAFLFCPWYVPIGLLILANIIWLPVRYRTADFKLATWGCYFVKLKWLSMAGVALYAASKAEWKISLLALLTPLISVISGSFMGGQVGVMQKIFLAQLHLASADEASAQQPSSRYEVAFARPEGEPMRAKVLLLLGLLLMVFVAVRHPSVPGFLSGLTSPAGLIAILCVVVGVVQVSRKKPGP